MRIKHVELVTGSQRTQSGGLLRVSEEAGKAFGKGRIWAKEILHREVPRLLDLVADLDSPDPSPAAARRFSLLPLTGEREDEEHADIRVSAGHLFSEPGPGHVASLDIIGHRERKAIDFMRWVTLRNKDTGNEVSVGVGVTLTGNVQEFLA